MLKKISLVLIFSLFIFSSCSIGLEKKKEAARAEGYEKGIEQGKNAARKDFEAKLASEKLKYENRLSSDKEAYENQLSSEKTAYENQLESNEKAYKQMVQETYNSSYKSGSESMQKDINEIIDMNSKKKRQSKDDWNEIKQH